MDNQDSAKKQLADRLKTANNILVTVSRDPSVDQLAACLGLTLLLNKLNKHTVAVFSGEVPSTIEFLKPEETIEKNTDSLRDFIIALDKDKADKLRYKVEDNVVRIFITPYKTSISQEDLEFSQGDFNVDVVVALGVQQQENLDEAITAHGRILHDATVASVNTSADGGLGTINWHEPQASSLSELVTELAPMIGENLLDNQIATALLTGIVAETGRFSNDKTSSQTMSASSALMAAGANQQLVATKLEEPPAPKKPEAGKEDAEKADPEKKKEEDGSLSIDHAEDDKKDEKPEDTDDDSEPSAELPPPQPPEPEDEKPEPPEPAPPVTPPAGSSLQPGAKLVTEPPTMGGALTANSKPEGLDPVTDPLSMPKTDERKLMNHPANPAPSSSAAPAGLTPPPTNWKPPAPSPAPAPSPVQPSPSPASHPDTLSDLEKSVHSPHLETSSVDSARDAVGAAFTDSNSPTPAPTPIQALNATPLGDKLHPSPLPDSTPNSVTPTPSSPTSPNSVSPTVTPTPSSPTSPNSVTPNTVVNQSSMLPIDSPSPESSVTDPKPNPAPDSLSPTPGVTDSTAPPPVPPPIPFQFGNNPGPHPDPRPNSQNPPL